MASKPKSIVVKAGNQFNVYVCNFIHNRKNTKLFQKNTITFMFIFKEIYFIFKVKEFSFYFWFKKRARFKFLLCISNKLIISCIAGPCRDIGNLFLRSLVCFAIVYAWKTSWIWVKRHLEGCMESCRVCSSFYFMHEDGSI